MPLLAGGRPSAGMRGLPSSGRMHPVKKTPKLDPKRTPQRHQHVIPDVPGGSESTTGVHQRMDPRMGTRNAYSNPVSAKTAIYN